MRLFISEQKEKKLEHHVSQICLCQLPALRRIYELDPDSHLARALGEHSRPRFISLRGAVSGTTSRRWSNLARTSDVTINHGYVSDVVCHIWSLVIYPNHHRGGAPNLSADTFVKFSSLEKSFGLTVESTFNLEIGSNDVKFLCYCSCGGRTIVFFTGILGSGGRSSIASFWP